jgi:hypothetical protein
MFVVIPNFTKFDPRRTTRAGLVLLRPDFFFPGLNYPNPALLLSRFYDQAHS